MTESLLSQDIALVTGASRGIGRAIAHELARQGARVVGTATSETGAQGVSQWLAEAGFKGRGAVLNVADAASIDALLKDIEAHEGAPTILVNNAGITRDNLLLRMKAEEWDEIMNTNLGSVFRLSKGVLRGMMKARRGRIISIASVVGVMGNAGQANYAAAKAGIIGFSNSVAMKYVKKGIRCNTVVIGVMHTPLVEQRLVRQLGAKDAEALIAQRHAQVPLGRMGDAWDAAHAVLFLASDEARYITGTELIVDGGISAARP